MPPRVTVIVPVHNAERYIEATLRSLLAQTERNIEILALDDASTDRSPEVVSRLAAQDPRICFERRAHGGLITTLNAGLSIAQGQYVARLDHDDLSTVDRLEMQARRLDAEPSLVAVGCNIDRIDSDGALIRKSAPTTPEMVHNPLAFPPRLQWVPGPTLMARTEVLREVGGFREQFVASEDRDACWRLGRMGRIERLGAALVHHRLHATNMSVVKRDRQLLSHILADFSAICAALGQDDTDVLASVALDRVDIAPVEAYIERLAGTYPARAYWLYYLVIRRAHAFGGFESKGALMRAAIREAKRFRPETATLLAAVARRAWR